MTQILSSSPNAVTMFSLKTYSPQGGSNSRPLVYKTSALSTELWRHWVGQTQNGNNSNGDILVGIVKPNFRISEDITPARRRVASSVKRRLM